MTLPIRSSAAVLLVAGLTGCSGVRPTAPISAADVTPTSLPIYDGHTGDPLTWNDALDRMAEARIVILGERHDDAVGHFTQQAIVEALAARWPQPALSMEMLERDEQILVDDYADGVLDEERFTAETFSRNWGGKDQWGTWYHPMVDTMHRAGGRVIAANAPRRYVRFARTDGYERLEELDADRRGLYAFPGDIDTTAYRDRFNEIMGVSHEDDPLGAEHLDDAFGSQLVWDATMADSIVRAVDDGAQVIHLVGQFHCDWRGGLVLEIERRAPNVPLLVVTMRPGGGAALLDNDRDRAGIVIYTN